jgi:hypothetical protein
VERGGRAGNGAGARAHGCRGTRPQGRAAAGKQRSPPKCGAAFTSISLCGILSTRTEETLQVRHICAYEHEEAGGDRCVSIVMDLMPHGALNVVLDRGWKAWVRGGNAERRPTWGGGGGGGYLVVTGGAGF